MFLFDPTYFLVLIGAAICLIASAKLNSTFNNYSKVGATCGLTGADVAKKILNANGIYDVQVNHVTGNLTDHYDPTKKVLNLSDSIYSSTSIAALGVAAHECGHAIQHNEEYGPLKFRSTLVPVANIGSMLGLPMILIGILLGAMMKSSVASTLINIGIFAFSLAVLFQIVTLPVEYNASDRALKQLVSLNILNDEEEQGAKKVLSAAALTYVAAAASSILQLLRLIILFGGRSDD